jgi:hypothetical protein
VKLCSKIRMGCLGQEKWGGVGVGGGGGVGGRIFSKCLKILKRQFFLDLDKFVILIGMMSLARHCPK